MRIINRVSTFLFLSFFSIAVLASDAADITNEWNNGVLSHTITPHSIDDISINGKLKGFMKVVLSRSGRPQSRFLNLANIAEINRFRSGVSITWKSERMRNGNGHIVTTVFIPRDVQLPRQTMRQLNAALNR